MISKRTIGLILILLTTSISLGMNIKGSKDIEKLNSKIEKQTTNIEILKGTNNRLNDNNKDLTNCLIQTEKKLEDTKIELNSAEEELQKVQNELEILYNKPQWNP